jgi:hypothetical protein
MSVFFVYCISTYRQENVEGDCGSWFSEEELGRISTSKVLAYSRYEDDSSRRFAFGLAVSETYC